MSADGAATRPGLVCNVLGVSVGSPRLKTLTSVTRAGDGAWCAGRSQRGFTLFWPRRLHKTHRLLEFYLRPLVLAPLNHADTCGVGTDRLQGFLPKHTSIIGYACSPMSCDALREQQASPRPTPYCDQKVANREIRVWHFVIKNGY